MEGGYSWSVSSSWEQAVQYNSHQKQPSGVGVQPSGDFSLWQEPNPDVPEDGKPSTNPFSCSMPQPVRKCVLSP